MVRKRGLNFILSPVFVVEAGRQRENKSVPFFFTNPAAVTRDDATGYTYTPAPGSLRLWVKDGTQSRKVAGLAQGGDFIAPEVSYPLAQLGTPLKPHTWRVYLEAVTDSAAPQPITLVVETNAGGGTKVAGDDTVNAKPIMASLVPDYDHNRKIDQADIERAERGDTYYFWINDDDDMGEVEGDNVPGVSSTPDYKDNAVDGMRDLIDFFPVLLNIKPLVELFDPAVYHYVLTVADDNLNFMTSELTRDENGAYLAKYLIDVPTAQEQVKEMVVGVRGVGIDLAGRRASDHYGSFMGQVTFPQKLQAFMQAIHDQGQGVLLVEGAKAGSKPLQLTVANDQGQEMASFVLNLSLDGVEQMFRHKNLLKELSQHSEYRLEGHDPVPSDKGMPDRGVANPDEGFTNKIHFAGFDAESDGNNFVHVHGYNVNDQDARGEQSELFKRLYWSGSKAKFWGITWYGWASQTNIFNFWPICAGTRSINYHSNIRHALNTGRLLKDFVKPPILDHVTILAHSLGNMVVSSAIQSGLIFDRYLMVNPAVAEEAYTQETIYAEGDAWKSATEALMYYPIWRYPAGQEVPLEEGYQPFLWASEWYRRFDDQDGRSKLTWRDRFASVRGGVDKNKIYAFFAPSDEAFRPFKYSIEDLANSKPYGVNVDDLPTLSDIWENKDCSDIGKIGTYSWVFQELTKGDANILERSGLDFDRIDTDSEYGGWGFNYDPADGYYQCEEPTSPEEIPNCSFITAAEANTLDRDRDSLRTRPLFSKNPDHERSGLYSDPPVSVPDALREELLANEVPALTFAVGHGGVEGFEDNGKNFDIRGRYLVGKTQWVRPISQYEWRHNDLYLVGYSYIYSMYDDWTKLIRGEAIQ